MEKTENRLNYIKKFPELKNSLKLSDNFLQSLENHLYFNRYSQTIRALKNDSEKVDFILLELTRERSTCATIIKLLQKDNQIELAEELKAFNESLGPMALKLDEEILVTPVTAPKKGLSMCYDLVKKKRGICVIINNVEEPQDPNIYDEKTGQLIHEPKGLQNETKRFHSIFKQLFFEVIILTKLSAKQMKNNLQELSEKSVNKEDEAFVLIVISHGADEKVLGYNACEQLRQMNFGEIKTDNENALKIIREDVIHIKDLVSIFNEEHCTALRSKPKLHFYICCRSKSDTQDQSSNEVSAKRQKIEIEDMEVDQSDQDSSLGRLRIIKQKNTAEFDTFVSYACAEEFKSYYNNFWGISYFGQSLTHSIAQYACDQPLSGIMSRTADRLRSLYFDVKKEEEERHKNIPEPKSQLCLRELNGFAIEIRNYALKREVYFNPGSAE